jgi:hypothetical protein
MLGRAPAASTHGAGMLVPSSALQYAAMPPQYVPNMLLVRAGGKGSGGRGIRVCECVGLPEIAVL